MRNRDFIVHQNSISHVAAINFKIPTRTLAVSKSMRLGACMQIHLPETQSYWFQARVMRLFAFSLRLIVFSLLPIPSLFLPRLFIRALFAGMASTFATLFLSPNLSQPVPRPPNSPSSLFTEGSLASLWKARVEKRLWRD
jgi:hypothetical protein